MSSTVVSLRDRTLTRSRSNAGAGRRGGLVVPGDAAWQEVFDQILADGAASPGGTEGVNPAYEQPMIDWFKAHCGYQANGVQQGDLEVVSGIVVDQPGAVVEGYDALSIRIAADDVEIRNCRVRSGSLDGIRYLDRFGRLYGGTWIHHVHMDQEDPSGSMHGIRLVPAVGSENLIEFCRWDNYTSGGSNRGDVEVRYNYLRTVDFNHGHRTGFGIHGARMHVHHNLAAPGYRTGSAVFPVYGSYGPCTDSVSEWNIVLDPYPDPGPQGGHYAVQLSNYEGAEGTTGLIVRNHYLTTGHYRYPQRTAWTGNWPSETIEQFGPFFYLDGTAHHEGSP